MKIFRRKRNKRASLLILSIILVIIIFLIGNYKSYKKEFSPPLNFGHVQVNFFYHLRSKSIPTTPAPNENVNSTNSVVTIVELSEVDGYESILDSRQKLRIFCDTCALVSSSGHLTGSRAGNAIENASCVIRTNNAPTQGFEVDVGNRTDIRVIGYTNLIRQVKSGLIMFESDQEAMFRDEKSRTKHTIIHWGHTNRDWNKISNSSEYQMLRLWSLFYPDVNFYSITRSKTKDSIKLAQSLKPKESPAFFEKYFDPSTGWFEMVLATDVCGEIHVYGMAPYWYCSVYPNSTIKYHYYTGRNINATDDTDNGVKECEYINHREKFFKTKKHRLASEKVVFETLAHKHGNIHFHHPSWNLTSAGKSAALPYFIKHSLKVKKKKYKTVIIKRMVKRGKNTTITRFTKKILIK